MLGICTRFNPRFVRRYGNLADEMRSAFERFSADVRGRDFPRDDESY